MRELPAEREEFDSNCVYVIWYHDIFNIENRCVCLTDKEYQQKHAEIVEMYSDCGRIETHVYVKEAKT